MIALHSPKRQDERFLDATLHREPGLLASIPSGTISSWSDLLQSYGDGYPLQGKGRVHV